MLNMFGVLRPLGLETVRLARYSQRADDFPVALIETADSKRPLNELPFRSRALIWLSCSSPHLAAPNLGFEISLSFPAHSLNVHWLKV